MSLKIGLDSLLERSALVFGKGIALCNHGNQVDLVGELPHELDVDGLEAVACGLDKVKAGMDAVVDELVAVDAVLLLEIGVEASLDVVQDRLPAGRVVDKVSEARCVDDSQLQADSALLNVGTDRLDVDRLGSIECRACSLLWGVESGVEEGIDEGGFAQSGLT